MVGSSGMLFPGLDSIQISGRVLNDGSALSVGHHRIHIVVVDYKADSCPRGDLLYLAVDQDYRDLKRYCHVFAPVGSGIKPRHLRIGSTSRGVKAETQENQFTRAGVEFKGSPTPPEGLGPILPAIGCLELAVGG